MEPNTKQKMKQKTERKTERKNGKDKEQNIEWISKRNMEWNKTQNEMQTVYRME